MNRRARSATMLAASLILWIATLAPAWSGEPFIRAKIETSGPFVIGQQVVISVDVLVPNFFMSSPKFPEPDLPDAVTVLQDDGQNLVETVGGETYAGIRRTYLVTPQAAGNYELPGLPIAFAYAATPGQPPVQGSVTLPAVGFTVRGTTGPDGGAVASKVTIMQELDRDPKGLHVGDAVVRTVTVTAEGMQAMMIPPPDFPAPEGVRTYVQDPRLANENSSRGATSGTRVDRVTYTFGEPGQVTLPAVEVGWYDPASGRHEVATAPEITVNVDEAPAFRPAIAPPAETAARPGDARAKWLVRAIGTAGLLTLAALIAVAAAWTWPRLAAWWKKRRQERKNSEGAFFAGFQRACRTGDCMSAYRALDTWARQSGIGPLASWLGEFGDVPAMDAFRSFEREVFAQASVAGPHDLSALRGQVARARAAWLRRRREATAKPPALPLLNP